MNQGMALKEAQAVYSIALDAWNSERTINNGTALHVAENDVAEIVNAMNPRKVIRTPQIT